MSVTNNIFGCHLVVPIEFFVKFNKNWKGKLIPIINSPLNIDRGF